jgi:hypothetical protein
VGKSDGENHGSGNSGKRGVPGCGEGPSRLRGIIEGQAASFKGHREPYKGPLATADRMTKGHASEDTSLGGSYTTCISGSPYLTSRR